jgi:hypothetical protein
MMSLVSSLVGETRLNGEKVQGVARNDSGLLASHARLLDKGAAAPRQSAQVFLKRRLDRCLGVLFENILHEGWTGML